MSRIYEEPGKYKVTKHFRISFRRQVLHRNLTLEQAQRIVRATPDNSRSMLVYHRQGPTPEDLFPGMLIKMIEKSGRTRQECLDAIKDIIR
jgi:hypothetical protein